MVLLTVYDEAMQKVAFAHPLCMPGSDATTLATDGPLADKMFHGAYTWAAWFWRALVREWKLLKPEEAVHRLTGMPAKILGLSDRGAIRVGARADIAVFSTKINSASAAPCSSRTSWHTACITSSSTACRRCRTAR